SGTSRRGTGSASGSRTRSSRGRPPSFSTSPPPASSRTITRARAPPRSARGGTTADLSVRGDAAIAATILRAVEGVVEVARLGADDVASDVAGLLDGQAHGYVQRLRVGFAAGATVEARALGVERCVAALVARGLGVREAHPSGGSLEDVFAALTREAPPPEGGA